MKWKGFLLGALTGIAVGWLTKTITDNQYYSPEEVLQNVKKRMKPKGKITGSWIMTNPEQIDMNTISYQVYRGGITCINDEEKSNFEFLADAKTGTIIELHQHS